MTKSETGKLIELYAGYWRQEIPEDQVEIYDKAVSDLFAFFMEDGDTADNIMDTISNLAYYLRYDPENGWVKQVLNIIEAEA